MNKKSLILCLAISAQMMSSCAVHRCLPMDSFQKDSTVIHVRDSIIYRDSIVFVNVERESTSSTIESSDTSHLETGIAESNAWIDESGKLHHSLRNKDEKLQPVKITIPEKVHSIREEKMNLARNIIIKEVEKELSWWQELWIRSGQIAWLFIIVYLFVFVIRKLSKSNFLNS